MKFKWKCPYCNVVYQYDGILSDRANGKCSNNKCINRRVSVKIWQYRIPSTCIPKEVYNNNFNITPGEVLKFGKKGPYPILNTDELRYLHKRLVGGSIREKPELIINSLIYNLINIKRRGIYNEKL
jgi:hypothetical protein